MPLLVAETSDGAHMNSGRFHQLRGALTYVRTSTGLKGGFTGAMRIAHTADSFRLRAEVHGGGLPNIHLCMAIPNTTYYESLVMENPVVKDPFVDSPGSCMRLRGRAWVTPPPRRRARPAGPSSC